MKNNIKSCGIKLPEWAMDICYNAKIFPNGEKHDFVQKGANCQVYAYELLRCNGKNIPDLRSSEMWEDFNFSSKVFEYEPGDLLFFNNTHTAWGAHVGVYIGNNKVLHNSLKVGKPVIWDIDYFKKYDEYTILLGGKRFL